MTIIWSRKISPEKLWLLHSDSLPSSEDGQNESRRTGLCDVETFHGLYVWIWSQWLKELFYSKVKPISLKR